MVNIGKYLNIPYMHPLGLNFFWKFEMNKNADMDNGCDESASNTASVFLRSSVENWVTNFFKTFHW